MFKEEANFQEWKIARHSLSNLTGLEKLKETFKGEITLPEDALYEQLREVYSKKGSPALVVQPLDNNDVSAAINFAVSNSLVISARSGGHGSTGLATNDGGIVIDLSNFNKVEVVDKSNGIVRVGAGAKWGDVAKELEPHRLAISSGDTKSVGVGGLVLGGGIGWMVRKYGFTIDSLVAADAVLADGSIIRISKEENNDLFWAIRGGGGNFCIVTNFEFIARKIDKVVFGTIQYGMEDIQSVLKGWKDYMSEADENLNSTIRIMPALFGMPAGIYILLCYAGKLNSKSKKAIEPFMKWGTVVQENVKEMNYPDVLEDSMHPPAEIKITIKNFFTQELSDDLIRELSGICGKENSPVLQVRSINGENNRIAPDATAFAFRSSKFIIGAGIIAPASFTESQMEAVLQPWKSLEKFGEGIYVNFTSEKENINDIYPDTTFERLRQIKRKYDPENIFNQNYNIKP